MKQNYILLIAILAVCLGQGLRANLEHDELQNVLDSIPVELIPDKFKEDRNDDSHWCCKTDPPIEHFQATKIVSLSHQTSHRVRCGKRKCGFLGLKRCTVYCTEYSQQITTHIDYFTVTMQGKCPQDQIICCNGHFLILGHCFEIAEILGNEELLAAVHAQGLVIPGVGK